MRVIALCINWRLFANFGEFHKYWFATTQMLDFRNELISNAVRTYPKWSACARILDINGVLYYDCPADTSHAETCLLKESMALQMVRRYNSRVKQSRSRNTGVDNEKKNENENIGNQSGSVDVAVEVDEQKNQEPLSAPMEEQLQEMKKYCERLQQRIDNLEILNHSTDTKINRVRQQMNTVEQLLSNKEQESSTLATYSDSDLEDNMMAAVDADSVSGVAGVLNRFKKLKSKFEGQLSVIQVTLDRVAKQKNDRDGGLEKRIQDMERQMVA